MKNIESFIKKALENVENDRATTKVLLIDAMTYIKKNEENHKTVGPVAAKYLETLQRSNEQLVKLAAMMAKMRPESLDMTENDKTEIFDQIRGEKSDEQ